MTRAVILAHGHLVKCRLLVEGPLETARAVRRPNIVQRTQCVCVESLTLRFRFVTRIVF